MQLSSADATMFLTMKKWKNLPQKLPKFFQFCQLAQISYSVALLDFFIMTLSVVMIKLPDNIESYLIRFSHSLHTNEAFSRKVQLSSFRNTIVQISLGSIIVDLFLDTFKISMCINSWD